MGTPQTLGGERARLGFPSAVDESFSFLSTLGFVRTDAVPTLVRYRKDDVELHVYHGRKSFEIGLEIGRVGERYSLSELIRASDPKAADAYRNPVATTGNDVRRGVERVANLLERYGASALQGDAAFFEALKAQRVAWSEAYALDVLAQQIRPKAEAAFREGRYAEAAALYEQIPVRLSPTERKKLAAARKRA